MTRPFDIPDTLHRTSIRFPTEDSRAASDRWRHLTGRRLQDDRSMQSLARRLNCLGHFIDDPGPRAA
ncbi:MAG: hypothetical protein MK074_08970 [Phycisphaerales bacterium]|nr:hypothetical protein [Phycisphaerales bacterium]